MQYNCVRIDPDRYADCWRVEHRIDPQEREDVETLPNAGGWYFHSPAISREEATKALLDCMCAKHQEEIDKLAKSLEKLKLLYLDT